MKIAYCTNVRLPSERAHGHQIAQVCDALAGLGHEVTIVAPYRRNPVTEDFWSYYGVSRSLSLEYLGWFDFINRWWLRGPLGLWCMNFFLQISLFFRLRRESFDVLYTRTPALLRVLLRISRSIILELHSLPRWRKRSFVRQCNRCALVVCLTSAMAKELIAWGVDSSKIIVEGDGVDLKIFQALNGDTIQSFQKIIPQNVPVLMYTGQLASMGLSKGVEVFLVACELLMNAGVPFHAVLAGGPLSVQEKLQSLLSSNLASRVTFLGHVPHASIPSLLSLASVLVYPAPKSLHPYFLRDTSPLKLFEYMASGKPIVAADLPPLRDVIDESMVAFFAQGDALECARVLEDVLRNPAQASQRAALAKERVLRFTWTMRMQRIFSHLLF